MKKIIFILSMFFFISCTKQVEQSNEALYETSYQVEIQDAVIGDSIKLVQVNSNIEGNYVAVTNGINIVKITTPLVKSPIYKFTYKNVTGGVENSAQFVER